MGGIVLTRSLLIALMILGICVVSAPAASKKKKSDSDSSASSQPSSEGHWHKIKSSTSDAKTKGTLAKFQPTTDKFRVTISAKPNTDGKASTLRVSLMEATAYDQDGKPANWKQLEMICEGEPKKYEPVEFKGGLDKDGKPKWFALSVYGQKAHYEIVIEDQGSGTSKSKDSEE
jgi:hypothetical protein